MSETTPHAATSSLRLLTGVVVVAVLSAAFASLFRVTIAQACSLLSGASNIVASMQVLPWYARLVLPAVGALIAGVVALVASRAGAPVGVGDVMESVVTERARLSMRTTLLKSLASWFAITSGGSIGREGPLVQFGGASGDWLAERLRFTPRERRMLVAAGVAAGFAAAYNTPFAAVLFVIEVVSGVSALELVGPTMLSTAVGTAVTRSIAGAGPIYGERAFMLESPLELLAYAGVGIAGALMGVAFMKLLNAGEQLFRSSKLALPWRPAIGGLAAGALVCVLPEVAGNGYEPLNRVLDGQVGWAVVALLVVAKAIATTASVSSGSPGGVFTPTLLIGGGAGFLVGVGLHAIFGDAIGAPGGYALVGMAATLAATTHAPLLAAVMAFELSGDYAVVLPLVVATPIAASLARRLRRDSIYTAERRAARLLLA